MSSATIQVHSLFQHNFCFVLFYFLCFFFNIHCLLSGRAGLCPSFGTLCYSSVFLVINDSWITKKEWIFCTWRKIVAQSCAAFKTFEATYCSYYLLCCFFLAQPMHVTVFSSFSLLSLTTHIAPLLNFIFDFFRLLFSYSFLFSFPFFFNF